MNLNRRNFLQRSGLTVAITGPWQKLRATAI